MINKVIEAFSDKLCDPEEFCWIERYGGLAKTVSNPSVDLYNNGKAKISRYPVSCTIKNKECWENELYLNLVPDDCYKSIVYFEETGGAVVSNYDRSSAKGVCEITQDLRLVLWINMMALGHQECSIMHLILPKLIQCFKDQQWPSPDKGIGKIYTNITRIYSCSETIRQVFSKYNYGEKYQLYLFPYEVASMDIRVTYAMDPACYTDQVDLIQCLEPVKCIDLTKLTA